LRNLGTKRSEIREIAKSTETLIMLPEKEGYRSKISKIKESNISENKKKKTEWPPLIIVENIFSGLEKKYS
jgi:hypothetical protein